MCGRFTLAASSAALRDLFGLEEVAFDPGPRYNIAPTQQVAVIPNRRPLRLTAARWGLTPAWAKDRAPRGAPLINARAETLASKPSFREAFARRRCLVPADGFYEWRRDGASKRPHYVRLRSGAPFAFAGLFEVWLDRDGAPRPSCAIVTTAADAFMAPLHHRMAVILPPERWAAWLAPEAADRAGLAALAALLTPSSPPDLEFYEVAPRVNAATSEGPECREPLPGTIGDGRGVPRASEA